jgi:hypothetical protein
MDAVESATILALPAVDSVGPEGEEACETGTESLPGVA